jgi:hypothetical protein
MLSTCLGRLVRAVMLLSARTAVWCSLLQVLAALAQLVRSSAQHCSTATRQASGNCSSEGPETGRDILQQHHNMVARRSVADLPTGETS